MSNSRTSLRRVAAGVGAAVLALAGAVVLAPAAHAEVGPGQPNAPTSGSLTISKYSGSPVGEGEAPDPNLLLDGVEFTVTQVGRSASGDCTPIDLTVADQWDGLDGLFQSAPAAPTGEFCELTPGVSQKTVDGKTRFDLDLGVYFVQETDPGEHHVVSKVPNFYVSIPMPEGSTADGWNYHVEADPKNQIIDLPSKTIDGDQNELVVGDTVTWQLSVPVPTLNNDEAFTSASVTDVLDSRLRYAASTVVLDGTTLTEGTHYEVDRGGVTWKFTAAGRALLDRAMGKLLQISLDTTVLEAGDGSLPNQDYSSEFNGATVPGEITPYTYWGQLSIFKHDDSPSKLALEGAEFRVFDAASDGSCPAEAPSSGSIASGTSDEAGIVQWENMNPADVLGLWVANSPDGPIADPTKPYCVYETVVPAGHSAVPINNPVTITPGAANTLKLDVENPKTEGPDLPLTGAGGTAALTIGGLLIIVAGAAAMLSRRRSGSSVEPDSE